MTIHEEDDEPPRAASCSNDDSLSFNYNYDPLAEYLQFIDDGTFFVDGVLSKNPVTPSTAT
ncbi:hypothetical protein RYX36_022910, partial [Vicia faba]